MVDVVDGSHHDEFEKAMADAVTAALSQRGGLFERVIDERIDRKIDSFQLAMVRSTRNQIFVILAAVAAGAMAWADLKNDVADMMADQPQLVTAEELNAVLQLQNEIDIRQTARIEKIEKRSGLYEPERQK